MGLSKTRERLHQQIDIHAKLCVAQIQMQAAAANDCIAHSVAWHNRSLSQKRRFENQMKFINGGIASPERK